MKNKLIILFLFVFELVSGQSLEIKLHIEKAEYLMYEPISVLVYVKNVGSDKISIPSFTSFDREILASITDQNGERVIPYEEVFTTAGYSNIYDLMPGEKFFSRIDLLAYGNYSSKIIRFRTYFEDGNYTIEMKYIYNNLEFVSNKQTIKIVKPKKEDEEGIITSLKDIAEMKRDKRTRKAIETIEKYSTHPLVQQAYLYLDYEALRYYDFNYSMYVKKSCIGFPNSFVSILCASEYIDEDSKFKDQIYGTNLYKKAIDIKNDKKKMQRILERNPYNEYMLRKMEERRLQKARSKNNEK